MRPAAIVLRGAARLARALGRAPDLQTALDLLLSGLERELGVACAAVLVADPHRSCLVTVASRGFGEEGVGSEARYGEGLLGTVAEHRTTLSIGELQGHPHFRRGRRSVDGWSLPSTPRPLIALPGLPEPRSALAVPLEFGGALTGVLASESHEPHAFGEPEEAAFALLGGVLAPMLQGREWSDETAAAPSVPVEPFTGGATLWTHHAEDDSLFVGYEYLIEGVPGRVLLRLLTWWIEYGSTEFSLRELREDPVLGLPSGPDQLETTLVLLQRRLLEKPCGVRVEPRGRGRITLFVDGPLQLVRAPGGG